MPTSPTKIRPRRESPASARGLGDLTAAHRLLRAGHVRPAVLLVFESLRRVKKALSGPEWSRFVERAIEHPIRAALHLDPLTRRTWEKPRGHAADAVVLDWLCRVRPPALPGRVSSAVHATILERPIAAAVRARRHLLAEAIDATARAVRRPDVLAMGAGHLREADLSRAVREGCLGAFFALDADADHLARIEVEHGGLGVLPVAAGADDVVAGAASLPAVDLVYAADLYERLDDAAARALTRALWSRLRPGGRLLVANLRPHAADAGYMEAIMGWKPICRTPEDLLGLFGVVEPAEIVDLSARDAVGGIGYAIARRA